MFFYAALSLIFCNGLFASEPDLITDKPLTKDLLQQSMSPIDLHNTALKNINLEDNTLSVVLLRKNFYQNLFFPSYLVLKSLKKEVSLAPFLWQIGSLLFAILSLIWLIFYLKQSLNLKRNLKIPALWFCGLTILLSSAFFNLRKRVTNLEDLELLNAPFKEALYSGEIKKGADLIFLKKHKEWLQIKTSQQQKGWVLNKDVIKTLE